MLDTLMQSLLSMKIVVGDEEITPKRIPASVQGYGALQVVFPISGIRVAFRVLLV